MSAASSSRQRQCGCSLCAALPNAELRGAAIVASIRRIGDVKRLALASHCMRAALREHVHDVIERVTAKPPVAFYGDDWPAMRDGAPWTAMMRVVRAIGTINRCTDWADGLRRSKNMTRSHIGVAPRSWSRGQFFIVVECATASVLDAERVAAALEAILHGGGGVQLLEGASNTNPGCRNAIGSCAHLMPDRCIAARIRAGEQAQRAGMTLVLDRACVVPDAEYRVTASVCMRKSGAAALVKRICLDWHNACVRLARSGCTTADPVVAMPVANADRTRHQSVHAHLPVFKTADRATCVRVFVLAGNSWR